jgi:hypothetical protein
MAQQTMAQEKAKELVEKMFSLSTNNAFPAKQCALITVDEVIAPGKDVDEFSDSYWEQVKEEINKL